jgi:hypothetical protein
MSNPVNLWPQPPEGVTTTAVYMQVTSSLRWHGRILQQAWQCSDGKIVWQDVPDADPEE